MFLPLDNPKINVPIISIVRPAIEEPKKPEPKKHTVAEGQTLTAISELYSVDLKRLWSANPQLVNPDQLNVSDVLLVPENTDILVDRPFPTAIVQESVFVASQPSSGGFSSSELIGSIGYAVHTGNCVNEPGVNKGVGNPSNWPALTQTPTIGATVLFTYNHTGVITGIWSDGSIEVRHQNYRGTEHRFPRSAFRGFR